MITPQYNDVLSGRGNGVGNHDGNVQFRSIVGNYIHEYDRTSSNASKKAVAMKIRKEIESLDPPGRFLSEKQGLYFPQGEKEILGKIKQALRDRLKAERGSQVSQQGAVFPMDSQIPQNQTGDTSRNPNRSALDIMKDFMMSSFTSIKSFDPYDTLPHDNQVRPSPPQPHAVGVSKRSLDIMQKVFTSNHEIIAAPLPIPNTQDNANNGRRMLPRLERILHQSMEQVPAPTYDFDKSSFNGMAIDDESHRDFSPLPFNAAPAFQMDEMLSNDAHVLPDNVSRPSHFGSVDSALNMGSLFSLEQYTSSNFMEL